MMFVLSFYREDKINASVWKPGPGMPYHKMLVPTVDSARNRFVI
jgi:dynein heavy chain